MNARKPKPFLQVEELPPHKYYYRFLRPFDLFHMRRPLLPKSLKETQKQEELQWLQQEINHLKQKQSDIQKLFQKYEGDPKAHSSYNESLHVSELLATYTKRLNNFNDEYKEESRYRPPSFHDIVCSCKMQTIHEDGTLSHTLKK